MNWNGKDIELFMRERDYVDTAIIPLMPVHAGSEMRNASEQGEFIHLLAMHLERQFKGRLLLVPAFTYLSGDLDGTTAANLGKWQSHLKENGFRFIFTITADGHWKELEVDGNLFFIPSIPLKDMGEEIKHSIMEEQVKKLIPDIVQAWQAAEA